MRKHLSIFITTVAIILSLPSCDDIYDDPVEVTIEENSDQRYEYINATEYTNWIYINLHSKTKNDTVTLNYQDTEHIPSAWDIALHRYDIKTNGGKALETSFNELASLENAVKNGTFPEPADADLVEDNMKDSITVDMSTMMSGYLGYAKSPKNKELCKWLLLDLSVMPPIYTPSEKVYLLKMCDGTYAAIRFTGYSNPNKYNIKGYISFDYLYPLTFSKE